MSDVACGTIGKMRSRIAILEPNDSKDSVGTPITDWTLLSEVAAHVQWRSGDEEEKETKATAIINVDFEIWYRSDLSKKHIINFRNRVFNILTILQIGRKRKMKLITQQIEITSGDAIGGTGWQTTENVWTDGDGNSWVW